ncbi:MAG: DUF393 domain-containing protein [Nevskiaceae bacterium]|nr:MAG: DUF393 domain-containing protein [Nevskiaceae bacterium]
MSNDFATRHPRLAELFGIDLRSLALFRFVIGLVLLLVLLRDFADLRAFYTDWGVMPRAWAIESDSLNRLSLYFLNGETWFVAALLGVQVVFAFMLMLGWRTRLAVIASFVLWTSLLNRNTLVLIGGDLLLACLLFWAMFLPLAARYSVDAALASNPPPQERLHLSWGSLGLLLQVVSVYFFSALLKTGSEWRPDFTAVYYALSLDRYATPLGHWLLNFPDLLHGLSGYVWWLELLGPLLVFVPVFNRPLRLLMVLCFMSMHIGFKLCLELGHFPFVSLASWTVFLGGWLWDAAERRHQRRQPGPLRIYFDRDCGFCLKSVLLLQQFLILPRAQVAPAQFTPRAKALLEANYSWVVIDSDEQAYMKWSAFTILIRHSPLLGWLWPLVRLPALVKPGDRVYEFVGRHRGFFGRLSERLLPSREVRYEVSAGWQRLAAVFIVAVLAWNLTTVQALPAATYRYLTPLRVVRIDQLWNMFAPYPLKDDGWFVIPAHLADGTELDLLHPGRGAPSYDKPVQYSQTHRNIRWHTYLGRLAEENYTSQRLYYGQYLCRQWNRDHLDTPQQRLMTFKLIYMLERTPPPGQQPQVEQVVLWRHECFPQETKGQIP